MSVRVPGVEGAVPGLVRHPWPAFVVLVAGLAVTVWAAVQTHREAMLTAQREFNFAGHEIGSKVLERLQAHEHILRSGAGLFAAVEGVTRGQWRDFVQSLHVEQRLPGIQGVGFARLVPREELEGHVRAIRNEGFAEFRIWPEGDRPIYSSIDFLEPFTNRNLRAFGYDMLSEPVRREALERARDQDTAALTGRVTLVQETSADVQAGTLMYVPVYRRGAALGTVEERRGALRGWVYSPYRMNDLMKGILGAWDASPQQHLRLQVFDGDELSPGALLYDSRAVPGEVRETVAETTYRAPIMFAGRRWNLLLTRSGGGLAGEAGAAASWVAGLGTALSLLLSGLTYSLLNTRFNARRLAGRLTADLQLTTERLALATEAGGVGVWDYEVESDALIWDDQMFRLYGISREKFGGSYVAWRDAVHPEDRERADSEIQMALRGERRFDTEFRVVRPDGTLRHIQAQARVQRDATGRALRLLGTNWDITARKETEAALKESQLFLLETQRIARLAGWKANPHTDYLEWTAGVFEIIEVPPSLQPGLTEGLRFYLPEYIPILRDSIARCLETGERFAVECRGTTGTGRVIWTEVRGLAPVRDGVRAYVMGTFQDITARKEAEEALRERESNFRTFFESMTDMIMVGTPAGRVLFTNEAVTRTLGYTPEELPSMHLLDLHPVDRRGEAADIFGAMFRRERSSCPLPLARKDGSLVPVETRVWFGRWDGADCVFGISKNLSAEVEAQQRFERLFRSNPALLALSTLPDRRFFDVNEAFVKVLGVPRQEAVGRTALELGLFDDPSQQAEIAALLEADGRIVDLEIQVRRRDGAVLSGLFCGEVIRSQGRQFLLSVLVDITERKRAEVELLRALTTERELSALKSTFVSMVSHEFRTPLGAILGAAEMLEDYSDRLPEEKRTGYFQIIRQEVLRMTGMLQDVLFQGQLDAGRVQYCPTPVELDGLVREIVGRVQRAFPRHPAVEYRIQTAPQWVWLDEHLLEHMLGNLLTNAYKYSPKLTPVRLVVEWAGEEWSASVTDQGIGIPEADRPGLFSAFRRGGNVGSIKGTGVGLYVVKKCLELQGGRVELRSEVGQGSTFTLFLPWRPAEPPAAHSI